MIHEQKYMFTSTEMNHTHTCKNSVWSLHWQRVTISYTFSDLFCTLEDILYVWREYWIYRELGFLAVVWFGSSPTTSYPVSRQKARPATHGGEGVGESQIIRWREGLVLYKSFNTLCIYLMLCLLHEYSHCFWDLQRQREGNWLQLHMYSYIFYISRNEAFLAWRWKDIYEVR